MKTPELIIVGGPNGSGKSTFALHHAKTTGTRYIGADQIAAELSPKNPFSKRVEASRQFITTIREAIGQRETLIVESTLAGKSMQRLILLAKSSGYRVTVIFAFLDSATTCVERVNQRVKLGGHHVPEQDIRRRFARAINNFWFTYRELADFWLLVYNSGASPESVAIGQSEQTIVRIEKLFEQFQSFLELE